MKPIIRFQVEIYGEKYCLFQTQFIIRLGLRDDLHDTLQYTTLHPTPPGA